MPISWRKPEVQVGPLLQNLDLFMERLNLALPQGYTPKAKWSDTMPNVVNIGIFQGQICVELYGLTQDPDGTVHWFENTTGRIY